MTQAPEAQPQSIRLHTNFEGLPMTEMGQKLYVLGQVLSPNTPEYAAAQQKLQDNPEMPVLISSTTDLNKNKTEVFLNFKNEPPKLGEDEYINTETSLTHLLSRQYKYNKDGKRIGEPEDPQLADWLETEAGQKIITNLQNLDDTNVLWTLTLVRKQDSKNIKTGFIIPQASPLSATRKEKVSGIVNKKADELGKNVQGELERAIRGKALGLHPEVLSDDITRALYTDLVGKEQAERALPAIEAFLKLNPTQRNTELNKLTKAERGQFLDQLEVYADIGADLKEIASGEKVSDELMKACLRIADARPPGEKRDKMLRDLTRIKAVSGAIDIGVSVAEWGWGVAQEVISGVVLEKHAWGKVAAKRAPGLRHIIIGSIRAWGRGEEQKARLLKTHGPNEPTPPVPGQESPNTVFTGSANAPPLPA